MKLNTTWSPGLEAGDLWPDLDDFPGAFVTADHRELLGAHRLRHGRIEHHVPGNEVLVGVAKARSRQLDQHFAGLGGIELDLLHAPLALGLPQDGCCALHDHSPSRPAQCATQNPPPWGMATPIRELRASRWI